MLYIYAKFGWKGPMVLQKKIFWFRPCILLFRNYLPLEKDVALRLNKLESHSPKDGLCQVWLKLAIWSWRRRFWISSMYFRYFVIISLLIRAWPFILINLNPFHPRMLCVKFGRILPSGSGEEDEIVKSLQTDGQTSAPSTQW